MLINIATSQIVVILQQHEAVAHTEHAHYLVSCYIVMHNNILRILLLICMLDMYFVMRVRFHFISSMLYTLFLLHVYLYVLLTAICNESW